MKKIILTNLLFIALVFQGQSQTRNLSNFSSLSVCGSIKVNLKKGSSPKADINMIKGDIEDLILEVDGDELNIEFKQKKNWGNNNNRKAEIELTYTSLDEIDACAGASVKSDEEITADDFDLDVSSGASVKIKLRAESVDVDVSSGANVMISGMTEDLDVEVSSGASFNGLEFAADNVDAEVSSGASVKVWAKKSIDAEASSGGNIKYKGDPAEVDLDPGKYSGGSIRKM